MIIMDGKVYIKTIYSAVAGGRQNGKTIMTVHFW